MRFILLLLSDCFQLRHHMIVIECEQIYMFFPHSHASCILLMLLDFLSFWVFPNCFLYLIFYSISSIHIVLLCERYFAFNSRTKKNLWAILSNWFYSVCLLMYCFLSRIWLFWTFGFHSWHGVILNTIQLLTLLPFHGSFDVSFLGHTLAWRNVASK